MKKAIAACLLGLAAGCATAPAGTSGIEQHYYARPTSLAGPAHPWVVILPGGGGMDVFGDTAFYFDVAKRWNAAGFDALVVHYQEAAPVLGIDNPAPGPMEAAVVRDALAAARRNGGLDLQCPGFVTGFSMGGAGTMALAADPPANLAGVVGYYPLVRGMPAGYRAAVPALVLQGDDDELTTRADLDAFLAGASDRSAITVKYYPGAGHGFDIPSLATPVEFNGGTFVYHAPSQRAANAEEAAFRDRVLAAHSAAKGCGR